MFSHIRNVFLCDQSTQRQRLAMEGYQPVYKKGECYCSIQNATCHKITSQKLSLGYNLNVISIYVEIRGCKQGGPCWIVRMCEVFPLV